MRGIVAAFFAFAMSCATAQGAPSTYPQFTAIFSTVELKSYPDAQAYSFTLQCLKDQGCTLTRISFEECKQSEDKKGELMNVWANAFSTNDRSLTIKFHSDRSLELQFANLDAPWNAVFKMSVSFTKDLGSFDSSVSSVSGTVLKTLFNSQKEALFELRRTQAPIERLKRKCPIGLSTY